MVMQLVNLTHGSKRYMFVADDFRQGSIGCEAMLKAGTHPCKLLQKDYCEGPVIEYQLIDYCVSDGNERLNQILKQQFLEGVEYHAPYVDESSPAIVLEQVDPDSGDVVMGWPSVEKAALVLGRSASNLEDVVDSGDQKYGFIWRSVG